MFGFLGGNGAGKTTTINILTGILTADSGTITYFGQESCEATKNKINAATAYNSLNRILTVEENLRVYAKLYNVKDARERIHHLLKLFDIFSIKDQKVDHLSTGQKTRVNLCKALVNEPELVFLDEATSGLDPQIAQKVRQEIKKLNATVIFTSHIMQEVEELCDRVAFLAQGRIVLVDKPEKIKKLLGADVCEITFTQKKSPSQKLISQLSISRKGKYKVVFALEEQKKLHEVLAQLIKSGCEIKKVDITKPTLDEVFIRIAQGELL